jgi:hypothetical protein
VYNPAPRPITAFVHVKFQKTVLGFGTSHHVGSSIDVLFDADDDLAVLVIPSCVEQSRDYSHGHIDTMLEID